MTVATAVILCVRMQAIRIIALIAMVSKGYGMATAYRIQNPLRVAVFGFEIGMGKQALEGVFIACLSHLAHFELIDQMEKPTWHACPPQAGLLCCKCR